MAEHVEDHDRANYLLGPEVIMVMWDWTVQTLDLSWDLPMETPIHPGKNTYSTKKTVFVVNCGLKLVI